MAGFNVGDKNFIRARFGIVTAKDQDGCRNEIEGIGAGLLTVDLKHLAGGYVSGKLVPERFSIYVRESGEDVGGADGDEGDSGGDAVGEV